MTGEEHYTIASGALPYHYTLWLEPNLKSFKYSGKATIKLRVSKAISTLKLNAKELKFKSATVKSGDVEQKAAFKIDDNQEATFKFPKPVEGEIELTVDYEGEHNDRLYGFYRSSYKSKGKAATLLSTQFEAPNARAAFPCLDEPAAKATFDVTMLIDKDLEAVSNMPIKQVRAMGKGKKQVTFHTTPKMSTYLLYLGVGKYETAKGKVGTLKLNVMATPGNRAYQAMPLDYGRRILADLQDYFRIKYPLPKLDLLAIPDFAVGAMENWGAITFRESSLLGNEKTTAIVGKQRIAETIAHEMAHMWFGDLVTMAWWDDMWLNESFATIMGDKSVDRVFPHWKTMQKYYIETINNALSADGMKHTHPISVKVNAVGEIEELFDAIGYDKGGSVLLMLEDFVGPELFRRGLTRYLKNHSYGNATKSDLWGAMEAECKSAGKKVPVVRVMEDWINREGYPVVSVKRINDTDFELEQERFTISGNIREGIWKIPISYMSEKGPGKLLMEDRRVTIKNAGSWIKLNFGQAGFYRVNYELKNLNALGKMIKDKKLSDIDAWGIENDLFAFVRSGNRPISDYLEFVRGFCVECGYPANVSISGHLGWFNAIARGEAFLKGAKELSLKFHRRILDRLGWDVEPGENPIDTKMRSVAISELGLEGEVATVSMAKNLFSAFMEKGSEINPNMRSAVYYTVAFNKPDIEKFNKLFAMYRGEGSPEDKIRSLQTMGMLGDTVLLEKALDLCVSKDVRLQDSMRIPQVVAGANPLGRQLYKNWAMKNWKEFMQKYDPSSHILRTYVQSFSMLADKESYAELEAFFANKANMRDDIKVEVRKALERISANIKFVDRNSQQHF